MPPDVYTVMPPPGGIAVAMLPDNLESIIMFNPDLYEVVCKATGKVVCTHWAYAPLEEEYADSGELYYIRNTDTGAEWDIAK